MNKKKIKQEELNQQFIEYCSSGEYTKVVEFYNKYYLKPNTFTQKIGSFLTLSGLFNPVLDPHTESNLAFQSAFSNGHIDIVEFLLNDKKFMSKSTYDFNKLLEEYFRESMLKNDVKALGIITPHIIKCYNFYDKAHEGFFQACCNGSLDSLIYASNNLNQSEFNHYEDHRFKFKNKYYYARTKDQGLLGASENGQLHIIKYLLDDLDYLDEEHSEIIVDAFNIACYKGYLDIVKYFTDPSEAIFYVDVHDWIPCFDINDQNLDIMRYFIFDLNLQPKEFLKYYDSMPSNVKVFFDKKDIYNDLQIELKDNNTQNISSKRLKL